MRRGAKILAVCLVALAAVQTVGATRIGVSYKDSQYIIQTRKTVASDDWAYFAGVYDAFAAVAERKALWEVYDLVKGKDLSQAPDGTKTADVEQARASYEEAVMDFMDAYSYGSMGRFADLWPIYAGLMARPLGYKNAVQIAKYGAAEFFFENL